jgi:hypothetical protein
MLVGLRDSALDQSRSLALPTQKGQLVFMATRTHPKLTFRHYGHQLGLSEDRIVEALCAALAIAGPAVRGGRYVGLNHPIGDDLPSHIAIEQLHLAARGTH